MKQRIFKLAVVTALAAFAAITFAQTSTTDLWTTARSNIRACPETTCRIVETLDRGTFVDGIETVRGQAVGGNTLWWEIEYQDEIAYIHNSLVTQTAPDAPVVTLPPSNGSGNSGGSTVPQVQPEATTAPPVVTEAPRNTIKPRNCTHARELGLTPQEAASWGSYLDRDRDGVACYGD